MTRNFGTIRLCGLLLTLLCGNGCGEPPHSQSIVPTTQRLAIECSDLELELETTLAWSTSCSGNASSLSTVDTHPVTVQLLSEDATDPLTTLLAMLKTQPGLHDVELHLTGVSICGALTCLSYKAKFQRLSQQIERLGVVAVGNSKSWEFTTSIDLSSSLADMERHLALHALGDLTHRLAIPKPEMVLAL